jgi:GAF domain-containing protein
MTHTPDNPQPAPRRTGLDLVGAYSELQNLLLDGPDVAAFLQQLAALTSSLVPHTSCGVTLQRDSEIATVVSSDAFAMRLDEIQYARGQGPCLQALQTGERVVVTDLTSEQRWSDYRIHALAAGHRSSVSLPLTLNGTTLGAVNLYSRTANGIDEQGIRRAEAFTLQGATALTLVLRHAQQAVLEDQLRDALSSRTVIDQALGMVMAQRQIGSTEAFAILREASQNGNRKLHDVATELIETITRQPAQPARPFTQRD